MALSTTKKAFEIKFCSRFKIKVSTLAFVFKVVTHVIFSTVKNFLQSRKFSTVKGTCHSQGIFPQSKEFSTIKEIIHSQRVFPQKKHLLNHGSFLPSKKFSTNNQVSHKNFVFFDQASFPQTKIFTQSKKCYTNKDQKGSLKAKMLDPISTKSYVKIFLTL